MIVAWHLTVLVLKAALVASARSKYDGARGDAGPIPLREGAWKYNMTHWLAREQLGKCINPELPHDSLAWLEELRLAASNAKPVHEFNAQTWYRPLYRTFGSVAFHLPYHRAVILTSGRHTDVSEGSDYPGARCHDFDYSAPAGSIPDPHGCGLFRRSFSRLQKLRTCATAALGKSPKWAAYRQMAKMIRANRAPHSRDVASPDEIQAGDFVDDPDFREVVRACARSHKCVLMDASRRVDEMIKYLSFQDWASKGRPWRTWVEGKVRYTASIFREKDAEGDLGAKHLGIEKEVVDDIVENCFGVPPGADGMTYDELPRETRLLERSLSCNAIMLDQVEVPGAPQPPVVDAATMWDDSLLNPAILLYDLKSTSPVCGRAAAAMAVFGQTHAKQGYSVTQCMTGLPYKPWRDCMGEGGFNCICFEMCWRGALRRLCDLAQGCCAD